jgi:hypothetical protein
MKACYRPLCADALPLMAGVPDVTHGESTTVDRRPFRPARFSLPLRARNQSPGIPRFWERESRLFFEPKSLVTIVFPRPQSGQ